VIREWLAVVAVCALTFFLLTGAGMPALSVAEGFTIWFWLHIF
jgi:hypothetical protein